MGFTGKRETASCCPSSLRMEQGDASLNYRVGFRLPQRVSSLRGAGRPDLLHARRGHHLQVTFPRAGARQRRWSKAGPSKMPSPLPSGTRDPGTNRGGGAACGSPQPRCPGWVVYFCFPTVRLQLDYSALTSQLDPPLSVVLGYCCFSHIHPVFKENTPCSSST